MLFLAEYYLYKKDWRKAELISKQAAQKMEYIASIRDPEVMMDNSYSVRELKSRVYYI